MLLSYLYYLYRWIASSIILCTALKESTMGVWICGKCYTENPKDSHACRRCGTVLGERGKDQVTAPEKGDIHSCSVCNGKTDPHVGYCQRCHLNSLKIDSAAPMHLQTHYGIDPLEQRIVLLGKTGAGKSTTANTILKQNCFTGKASPKSVTNKCQYIRRERFNRKLLIVDTPGLFDTTMAKKIVEQEIKKCVTISAPGPHAFLLVTSLTNRFTDEESRVFSEIGGIFGDHILKYLIVVFTGKDQIEDSVEAHMKDYPEEMKQILDAAGGGYVTINNRGTEAEKESDVKVLLERIAYMLEQNGGSHFNSDMFDEAEQIMQDRITRDLQDRECEMRKDIEEEIRAEIEESMKRQREEFKKIHEKDVARMGKMKKELKKEREKAAKKYKKESRGSLGELILMEMKINEKHMNLQTKIEAAEGSEKRQLQDELMHVEEELKHISEKKKKVEEVMTGERLTTSFISRACEVREEVRHKTEKEDKETLHHFGMIKMFKRFINLFKEK